MPRDGQTHSYVAGFAEVEVDLETGKYKILDYLGVADVGTIIHPRALGGQILGRSMLGIGHAIGQKWVYDQHYGLPLAKRSTTTSRQRFSMPRPKCSGPRSTFPIPKRPSARAASANRRWARVAWRLSMLLTDALGMKSSGAPR
jgi:hypothetical protein